MGIAVSIHPLAGKVSRENIVNLAELRARYKVPMGHLAPVEFGTSGHRGSSLNNTFNEDHIIAISQAVFDYKKEFNITGPIFLGVDQHPLSKYAAITARDVFSKNGKRVFVQTDADYEKHGFTPTPVISFAIINANKYWMDADGIVITPSHNPPADGGFKYNPPNGGPADSDVTKWIQNRANEIMKNGWKEPKKCEPVEEYDFVTPYVEALKDIIDIDAIKKSGIKLGVDPLGGASLEYYFAIAKHYGLDLEIVNKEIDKTFSFMPRDWDGKIRMDCSSKYAMKNLVALKDKYDVAWGNDTDADRHGIVTPYAGLMNPNHYLSVAIWYLLQNRPQWNKNLMVGKTVVTTSLINRAAKGLGREVYETPVGFKYFADGLFKGSLAFGCEESAGASFLRKDGSVWTTDKDGIILGLLAAEIRAVTGKDIGLLYEEITAQYGKPNYERIDTPADKAAKAKLKSLKKDDFAGITELAGEKILDIQSDAPYGGSIGGIKVITENGWFAARPSGTEDVAKLYAESFISQAHLERIQEEAQKIIAKLTK